MSQFEAQEDTEAKDTGEGAPEWEVTGGTLLIDISSGSVTGYTGSPTSVEFPAEINGVKITKISSNLFSGCESLTSVRIPEGYEEIGEQAFYNCRKLAEVTLPETMKTIGNWAFTYGVMKEIRIPEGIEAIPQYCFYECNSLKKVYLPSTLTRIRNNGFYGCDNLMAVYFYGTAPALDSGALTGCSGSMVLYYTEGTDGWTSPTWNGYHTAKFVPVDKENLVSVEISGGSLQVSLTTGEVTGYEGTPTSVEFPAEVNGVKITKVGDNLFSGCESLKSVTIPEGYEVIGANAFNGCTYLQSVRMGTVRTVGMNAFRGCSRLSGVDLGKALETVEEGAFYSCTDLGKIELPETARSIGKDAFYGCGGLTGVTLPEGLKRSASRRSTIVQGSQNSRCRRAWRRLGDMHFITATG